MPENDKTASPSGTAPQAGPSNGEQGGLHGDQAGSQTGNQTADDRAAEHPGRGRADHKGGHKGDDHAASPSGGHAGNHHHATTSRAQLAERHEARRRQILDAAAQLFYTKGYPGMTMNDLCRVLGVTKPAVYYYFTDKYEIFDILCRESAQACLPVIRETADPTLPVRERLERCLLEMARRCVAFHHGATLGFRDNQYLRPDTLAWLERMARDFYRDLYALLDEGKAAGEFAYGDSRVTAHAIGSVVGFLFTWHQPGRVDDEALARELCTSMMKLVLPCGMSK